MPLFTELTKSCKSALECNGRNGLLPTYRKYFAAEWLWSMQFAPFCLWVEADALVVWTIVQAIIFFDGLAVSQIKLRN